ncbi:hypothetical protein EDB19DRAFT_1351358 [Suillus lakei]|nr:hypothetical protein EDB19DRAFT_1351358 [Suillus lakei]
MRHVMFDVSAIANKNLNAVRRSRFHSRSTCSCTCARSSGRGDKNIRICKVSRLTVPSVGLVLFKVKKHTNRQWKLSLEKSYLPGKRLYHHFFLHVILRSYILCGPFSGSFLIIGRVYTGNGIAAVYSAGSSSLCRRSALKITHPGLPWDWDTPPNRIFRFRTNG